MKRKLNHDNNTQFLKNPGNLFQNFNENDNYALLRVITRKFA
jgi:hypothetical protein